MNKKTKKEPDVKVKCHKCGKEYIFDDFEMLDYIDISTKCDNCGFKLFEYSLKRITASMKLLETNPKYIELIKANDYESLNNLVDEEIKKS